MMLSRIKRPQIKRMLRMLDDEQKLTFFIYKRHESPILPKSTPLKVTIGRDGYEELNNAVEAKEYKGATFWINRDDIDRIHKPIVNRRYWK
ncbi:hypothetical protein F373_gp075 [Bacillus phage SP-10]|uniref:hypothetical protein n=1 Tax=Bacillus phage SP10 TaxID=941058 RepID=UPI0002198B1F|nr:hypothetical protein F373_gp075 [Bacillus phage SP-10]BAK52887.1 hypothetical protein [Bacillus phage SP-10]